MSEIKHTPGPWTYSRWDEHGYTKFYVSQQEGAPYTPEYSNVAGLISETVSGERVAIQEANACLIAAAPELLEALMQVLECCGEMEYRSPPLGRAYENACVAIAKATGA